MSLDKHHEDNPPLPIRMRCKGCGHTDYDIMWQIAVHPFRKGHTIYGCPDCGELSYDVMCHNAGCSCQAGVGIPTPSGYAWLCGNHADAI